MASSMALEQLRHSLSELVVDSGAPGGAATSWQSLPHHLQVRIFQTVEALAESESECVDAERAAEHLEMGAGNSEFGAVGLASELREGCGDWDGEPSRLSELALVCKEWHEAVREAVTVVHVHALRAGACFYNVCGGREGLAVSRQLSRLPNVTHLKFHSCGNQTLDSRRVLSAALASLPRLTAITLTSQPQGYQNQQLGTPADLTTLLLATNPSAASAPLPATPPFPTTAASRSAFPVTTATATATATTTTTTTATTTTTTSATTTTATGSTGAVGSGALPTGTMLPTGIRQLALRHGATLRSVSPSALVHLTTLHLHNCPQLMSFPPLTTAAPHLLHLHLSHCPMLNFSLTPPSASASTPPAPPPLALTSLRLNTLLFSGPLDVTPAPSLTSLQVLNCGNFLTLRGLSTLTNLHSLSWCGDCLPWEAPPSTPAPSTPPPSLFAGRTLTLGPDEGHPRGGAPFIFAAAHQPLPQPGGWGFLSRQQPWGPFPLPGLTALHLRSPGAWVHALLCQVPLLEELQLTGVHVNRMDRGISLSDMSRFLDPLAHMARLKRLRLTDCAPVRIPAGLGELASLTELRMKTITAWEPFGAATATAPPPPFTPLDAWLAPMTRLPHLLTLHLDGICLNHAQLPPFHTLTSLRSFTLHGVSSTAAPLGPPPQHTPFSPPVVLPAPPYSFNAFIAAPTASPHSPLTTISLQIPAWHAWRTLPPRTVSSLTHLELWDVEPQPGFSLDPLVCLTALKTLTVFGAVNRSTGKRPLIPDVQHLASLERLNLAWCQMRGVKKLKKHKPRPPGHRLSPSLCHLELIDCDGPLFALEPLPHLHRLRLQGKYSTLPEEVVRLTSLTSLSLRRCYLIQELPAKLGDLVELRVLDLRGSGLETLVKEAGEAAWEVFGLKRGVHLITNAQHTTRLGSDDEDDVDNWRDQDDDNFYYDEDVGYHHWYD